MENKEQIKRIFEKIAAMPEANKPFVVGYIFGSNERKELEAKKQNIKKTA